MKFIWVAVVLLLGSMAGCANDPSVAAEEQDPFLCATGYKYVPKSLEPLAPNVETARRLGKAIRLADGQITLVEYATLVEEKLGVTIWFDWPALKDVGVTPKTTIQIKKGRPPADRALSMLLWYTSPEDNTAYPTYMIVDGLVVVGTNRSLVKQLPQVNWPKRDDPTKADSVNHAVRLKLDQHIRFEGNASLGQIIQLIKEQTGLPINANWRVLEEVGIDRDRLVTVSHSIRTAGELLDESLAQLSEDAFDDDKITYLIREGQVYLSTIRDLHKNHASIKNYNINDLLLSPYSPALQAIYQDDPFALKLLGQHHLAWQVRWLDDEYRLGGNEFLSREEVQGISRYDQQHFADELTTLIRSTSGDLDAWLNEEWVITDLDGVLSVKTIEPVHHAIEKLLGQLRETRRLTMLRFMRELEATRLLRKSEQARQAGENDKAYDLIKRAQAIDPGNELIDVLLEIRRLADEDARPSAPNQ